MGAATLLVSNGNMEVNLKPIIQEMMDFLKGCPGTAQVDGASRTLLQNITMSIDDVAEAMVHDREGVELLCSRLARFDGLRALGSRAALFKDIAKTARRLTAASNMETSLAVAFGEYLTDAAMQHGIDLTKFRMPSKFMAYNGGIYTANDSLIVDAPIIIAAVSLDVDTDLQTYKVAWFDRVNAKWCHIHKPVSEIMNARAIHVALANSGAPVTSENARATVKWLTEFRSLNAPQIPIESVVRHLGWTQDCSVFVMPDEVLSSADNVAINHLPQDGMKPRLDPFRVGGSYAGWIKGMQLLAPFPMAFLGFYTACASVFMEPVFTDAEPFILDYGFESGSGKTTSAQIAGAVWGYPATMKGILFSWEDTYVSTMALMSALHSLPLILDESQRTKNDPKKIDSVVHALTQGRDRSRGLRDGGVKETASFKMLGISTGENSILAFTSAGGVVARVLAVRARPFGPSNPQTKPIVEAVKHAFLENHGHFGPMLLKYILDNKEEWAEWREEWKRACHTYSSTYAGKISGNATVGRLINHVALLHVVANIVHVRLGVPVPEGWFETEEKIINPAIQALERQVTAGDVAVSRGVSTFMRFREHIVNNMHRFRGREERSNMAPPGGWLGLWESTAEYEAVYVSIDAARREIAFLLGVPVADELLLTWTDKGFLGRNPEGHYAFPVEIRTAYDAETVGTIQCIKIPREQMLRAEWSDS